jgi:L1 cell adhesion molecule like protein
MTIVPHNEDPTIPAYEVEEYENEEAEEPITKYVTVNEVTTKYLRKLKETAESYMGKTVTGAVISIPAHFAEVSKNALLETAKEAGFNKVIPISEPVAAALAFDNAAEEKANDTTDGKTDRQILVVDLGGHQFNVTLLSANSGLYTVVTSLDDYKLGGVHFDEVLVNFVKGEFKRKTKSDISGNRRALGKLRNACEQTKRMLSQKDTAPCSIDSLYDGMDYHGPILRGRFEMLAEPLFQRCAELVLKALSESEVQAANIDEVLLVGGSSRIPRFQAVIRSLFPETTKIRTDVEPDEAVGMGAAAQANIVLTVESAGVDFLKESAAKDVVELHQLQHSIGIEAADGSFAVLIPRRAPVPARRAAEFSNAVEGQNEIYLAVYEGENAVAKKNQLLAEIVLSDLPQGLKAGEAKIDVTFLVEKDEILTVVARERKTGKQVSHLAQFFFLSITLLLNTHTYQRLQLY